MFHFSTTLPHLFLSVLLIYSHSSGYKDFPRGSDSKESVCNEGDLGSILGSRRSPGKENCNPLQYSWLRNPMDRRVWATVHGVSPWGHKRVGHDWETKHVCTHVYSAWCKVVAHWDCYLHAYDDKWCWESFYMFIGHFYTFYENPPRSFAHF